MKTWHLPSLLIQHPLLAAIFAGLLALGVQDAFIRVEQERNAETEKNVVLARISSIRSSLESELNASLSLSLGLSTFVLSNPDYSEKEFAQVAASLIHIRPSILSVALAPDNVIRQVYPRPANDRALGLRYMDNPQQRDAVLRLMQERKPVIAGPIQLVQGGQGIINRIPILFIKPNGDIHYWGLASVAVDPQPIFRQAGIFGDSDSLPSIEYALRGRDGLGARGEVFLGKAALFTDPQSVLMDVIIPGGSWQLAARPLMPRKQGLNRYLTTPLHLLALLLAGLAGFLAHSTLSAHRRMRTMALQDSLTGLANRHQFNLRGENLFALAKRSGRHLTLLNMDLNDFKLINDTRGHAVGDQVLVHVANQLRKCFRDSDLVARVGGDEFLALLPDTSTGPGLDTLLQRVREAVIEPLADVTPPVRAGICIGIATCTEQTATLDDLMRLADDTMYQAKIREKFGLDRN
jgi:diguanylate cyclase (GGDEF)-like protein